MKLLDIYARFKKDINLIEREMDLHIRSDHHLLNDTSLHLLKAGGKRIRPVFVLLSGQFGQYDLERIKHVAIALELIHMASLVHDDVIDDAETRRGQLTVKSKWDSRIAMYTGDYIFAKALEVSTELENPAIHRILSKAIVQMSIGEMEQIRHFFNVNQSVRNYLLRIRRKTALLIAISCQLGAIATDAPAHVSRLLYSFGYNIGMAFQIRDDILDICGTEQELGKPPGSDIKQGNVTLPFILECQANPNFQKQLIDKFNEYQRNPVDLSSMLEQIKLSEGMKQAEAMSERYIDKAMDALNQLPNIRAQKYLHEIALFVGNRSY